MSNGNSELTAGDVARYLRRSAVLLEHPVTGNVLLGRALADLATVLDPVARQPIGAVTRNLREFTGITRTGETSVSRDRKHSGEAERWRQRSLDELFVLINDGVLSKKEFISMGQHALGMSPSSLQRLTKPRIRERLLAALDNQRALRSVSEQAAESGAARKS